VMGGCILEWRCRNDQTYILWYISHWLVVPYWAFSRLGVSQYHSIWDDVAWCIPSRDYQWLQWQRQLGTRHAYIFFNRIEASRPDRREGGLVSTKSWLFSYEWTAAKLPSLSCRPATFVLRFVSISFPHNDYTFLISGLLKSGTLSIKRKTKIEHGYSSQAVTWPKIGGRSLAPWILDMNPSKPSEHVLKWHFYEPTKFQ
jgi:hypothetical protein